MGFMDKAKKMAEQAQAKLDEAQKQFNQQSGSQPQGTGGPAVEYDQHGRPIAAEPAEPAETATPPHGDPVGQPAAPAPPPAPAGGPTPDPAAPAPPESAAPAPPSAPSAPTGPQPSAEDPNRPSYAPPKMTSGDPLG